MIGKTGQIHHHCSATEPNVRSRGELAPAAESATEPAVFGEVVVVVEEVVKGSVIGSVV
jgi:hypothetical protein